MRILAVWLFLVVIHMPGKSQPAHPPKTERTSLKRIVVAGEIPATNKLLDNTHFQDMLRMRYAPVDYVANFVNFTEVTGSVANGVVKWVYKTDKPLYLSSRIFGQSYPYYFAEPGDSIFVRVTPEGPVFSGNGNEKYNLIAAIGRALKAVPKPANPKYLPTRSLRDYLDYARYCNLQWDAVMPLLAAHEKSIPAAALECIKNNTLADIEYGRHAKFANMVSHINQFSLTADDLCRIYDSTILYGPAIAWDRSLRESPVNKSYLYTAAKLQVFRRFGFNQENDSIRQEGIRYGLTYQVIDARYTGHVRENALIYLLSRKIVKHLRYTKPGGAILQAYYSEPAFPEYKKWVRDLEASYHSLKRGKRAPDFALTGVNGNNVTKKNLQGKVVLLDFWFSGCKGCVPMAAALQQLEDQFRTDSNVLFVSVSIDRDRNRWLKSIEQKKYTTAGALHLYTGGEGTAHDILRRYNVTTYPHFFLLDPNGHIVLNDMPDPTQNMEAVAAEIREQLAIKRTKDRLLQQDGPYIYYANDSISVSTFRPGGNPISLHTVVKHISGKATLLPHVSTDLADKHFPVTLKQQLEQEPCEFKQPSQQFVVSDIEGNFNAFRKLLQAGGVIDEDFNWTFGTGHLVCLGDFFDRGTDVSQVLWLIYSLEEKAKLAGGYVHFILGNHEIMNLRGDTRYVQEKYKTHASLLGKDYKELYGPDSEMGRWLRTKNIIEKIGGNLYVHGGISPQVNRLPLTIGQMNDLARRYYDVPLDSTNRHLLVLFESDRKRGYTSPFWFRGYYGDGDNPQDVPSMEQVDSTLGKFAVNRIITGHTLPDDDTTITVWYRDKIINVDTRHAKGQSEALLIRNGKLYRVNAGKQQIPLLPAPKLPNSNHHRITSETEAELPD